MCNANCLPPRLEWFIRVTLKENTQARRDPSKSLVRNPTRVAKPLCAIRKRRELSSARWHAACEFASNRLMQGKGEPQATWMQSRPRSQRRRSRRAGSHCCFGLVVAVRVHEPPRCSSVIDASSTPGACGSWRSPWRVIFLPSPSFRPRSHRSGPTQELHVEAAAGEQHVVERFLDVSCGH